MSYFGGLGAGKGWNTFKFIITPQEFESLFQDLNYYFVITGSRVEINYKNTDEQYIFDSYKSYYNEVLTGENKFDKKEQWSFERDIRISITDDLCKINFQDIIDKKGIVSNDFKLVRPTEPVINISPFYLTYSKTFESLSISYMNNEGSIGLELTYPKIVSFESDNFKSLVDTHSFTTNTLFNNLIENIKAISNKAKLQSTAKLFRPNFWISPDAKKVINQNHYLKSNDLNII
ncbi:hypothetical protein [Flavobacterium ginsenosidimutans]|uniref:Uncharacterized protein n=1 Tax=Flavobacterium ginsenosidimutans TaxID=687844 RepID=A0ABZ2QDG5_9FLAO|nr:hypothetical protein [Flavobacterium ginsenosidimutans]KAF2333628.1 hypothetical protein DM444_08240 [Flavobacterium ginsenosidimutans]